MSPRPLVIVHTENSLGWGGQEVRILTEARGFIDRGHEVTLLAAPEAPITGAARRMGVPVVALDLRRKRPRDFRALRGWLRERDGRIDILNTHSSTDSWLGALACRTLRAPPVIVRTRHVSTRVHANPWTRWLYRKGNAHIVTTGEAVRRQLAAEAGVAMERMTSIPTGIDLARVIPGDARAARARLGLPARHTLGIVATLRAWKGHRDLFDALRAGSRTGAGSWEGWQVLVVGGGPDREMLERYANERGLGALVRFTGHQDDVVPWLQALDLFALPSYGAEGGPQSIMQAMACAVPVVSTPIGGITEAVDAEVTGLIVEPRNPPALAAALARLRDDGELRIRMGEAAREKALRRFGIERMLDAMEAVFRSVVRRP